MRRPGARTAGEAIARRKYDTREDQLAYAAGYRDGWSDMVIEEDRAAARANLEGSY